MPATPPLTLLLLRHGESTWNAANRFTGWVDVELTERGAAEARRGGELLAEQGLLPDVVHTSVLVRAIHTAELALRACNRSWVPVRRHWRLNERHYGALQGLDKREVLAEHGAQAFHRWRRSYDSPPPPLPAGSSYDVATDARYAGLAPEVVPRAECLKDVVDRMLPYWYDAVVPDLRTGAVVLLAAHGNSLRALVKHLDGVSDSAITELNIPTGNPLVYRLGPDLRPVEAARYLDPAAAAAGAAEVARQGQA
ncbi:MAG: phosphoglyceromutase [Mycobacteriales bacterium]